MSISTTCLFSFALSVFSYSTMSRSVRLSYFRSFLKYSRCSYFNTIGRNFFLFSHTYLSFLSFSKLSIVRCLKRLRWSVNFNPHLQSLFSLMHSEHNFSLHLPVVSSCNSKYNYARVNSFRLQMVQLNTPSILYMTNFRTGEAYLNERLFKTGRSRYGMESTCLNVHYLPDFMAYTK